MLWFGIALGFVSALGLLGRGAAAGQSQPARRELRVKASIVFFVPIVGGYGDNRRTADLTRLHGNIAMVVSMQ
jgi:hypothetical protein